jgi:hypothetical protein
MGNNRPKHVKPLFPQLIHMAPQRMLEQWASAFVPGFIKTAESSKYRERRAVELALIAADTPALRDEVLTWVRISMYKDLAK